MWDDLKRVARSQGRTPESLARHALRAYLGELTDEELIRRSTQAARRTPFRIGETERVLKKRRNDS
jgi:hypothetical protein